MDGPGEMFLFCYLGFLLLSQVVVLYLYMFLCNIPIVASYAPHAGIETLPLQTRIFHGTDSSRRLCCCGPPLLWVLRPDVVPVAAVVILGPTNRGAGRTARGQGVWKMMKKAT